MQPILATPDFSDNAVITSNSENPAALVTNLQTMPPKKIWQSLSDTGVTITLDRGSAMSWNLVFLGFTNLAVGSTVRIRAAQTEAALTSGPVHDSTTLPGWAGQDLSTWSRRHFLYWPGSTVTTRWLLINIEDGANPDGFVYAGRLYVSQAWQSPLNMQLGMQHGYIDHGVKRRSALDATLHVRQVGRTLITQFALGYLTEAQLMDNLFEIDRLRGSSEDILLIHDTPPMTYQQSKIVYGLFTQSFPLSRPRWQRFEHRVEVEELV